MKKKLLYIFISVFLFFNSTKAQTNLNLYNFRNVGQGNLLNPGIRPIANFTFGLPSLYVSGQMPEMTLANLFNKEENADSTFRRIVRDPNLSFNNINGTRKHDQPSKTPLCNMQRHRRSKNGWSRNHRKSPGSLCQYLPSYGEYL
jgi:hypothetical protein